MEIVYFNIGMVTDRSLHLPIWEEGREHFHFMQDSYCVDSVNNIL